MTFDDPGLRAVAPSPLSSKSALRSHRSVSAETPNSSTAFHEPAVPIASRSPSPVAGAEDAHSGYPSNGVGGTADSIGGGGGNMSDSLQPSSTSERGRSSGMNRRSRSQSASARRPPARQSLQHPPQQHLYPIASASRSQDIHTPPASFHGASPQYPSPPVLYDPRGSYVGPYTISQQPPLSMAHTPPPFSYPHGFSHPGSHVPESSILSRNMHGGFQPMMQPHAPVYPYQGHSPNGAPPAHQPFSSGSSPSHFPHHVSSSPPPHPSHSSQSSTGQAMATHSASFAGQSGQFHSLPFPSTPPYPYPPQSFATSSPLYQSPYPTSGYQQHPQHFTTPTEQEDQGSWWYVPHNTALSPSQYDGVQPSYQGAYPMTYSHIGQDGSYVQPAASPSVSPAMYPMSPSHPGGYLATGPSLPSSPVVPSSGSSQVANKTEPGIPSPAPGLKPGNERPIIRRPYHPNPPAHRSEWVMWVGNVPSDATHDELWRFLNEPLAADASESSTSSSPGAGGVMSVFLISRSSCAFINFESASHLQRSIERFNGQQLRPQDPRCPRLVCRVRKKDDDLKAGVGGQRGMGVHTRWVKKNRDKARTGSPISQPSGSPTPEDQPTTPSSPSDYLAATMSSLSMSSDEEGHSQALSQTTKNPGQASSSGSYASTNSSILTRHFPKRYFILKSLTQFDLDLSVEKGLWATQRHNEGVLDQAFRTSKDVYLIFGVNKSGEFYGYARMCGPILQGEQRVSWAVRTDSSPSSHSSMSPATGRGPLTAETIPEEPDSPSKIQPPRAGGEAPNFFPAVEHRLVEQSPLPALSADLQNRPSAAKIPVDNPRTPRAEREIGGVALHSAPGNLGPPLPQFSLEPPRKHPTYVDIAPQIALSAAHSQSQDFELDPRAPERAARANKTRVDDSSSPAIDAEGKLEGGNMSLTADDLLAHDENRREEIAREETAREETWGESFKIEWVCTERLPFYRTRHIRNPWNHDREVKVSRDGTELEPSTGQKLLEEWERLSEPQQPLVPPAKPLASSVPQRGGVLKSAPASVMQSTFREGAGRKSGGGGGASRS